MKYKFFGAVLGTVLGIGAATAAGSAAFAAPVAPTPGVGTATSDTLLVEVAQNNKNGMRKNWNARRDGLRCRTRTGKCRHYYRGNYYQNRWWTLPLFIGGAILLNDQYNGNNNSYGNSHIRWCANTYRSYNPRTNLWLSYSGQYRQCNSPYSR